MPSAPARPAPPTLAAWRNAVFAVFVMCGIAFASWASRVPDVRRILDASTQQMGLVILGLSAGSILGLLAAGRVIGAVGATRTLRWALTLAPVGLILAGVSASLSPSFLAVFLGMFVFGVGYSTVDVAMNLHGAVNERALGRTLMPLFHAGFSFGTVVGAGLGALSLVIGMPIGIHFLVIGLLTATTAWLATRRMRPAEDPHPEHGVADPGRPVSRLGVWSDRRVLLIGLVVFGFALAEGSANDWLSLAMVDGHGVTEAAGAAIFGVFVAAMTVSRVAGTFAIDRWGRVAMLRVTAGLAIAGLLLMISVSSVPVAVAGVVLWGLGAGLGFPIGMSAAADDPRTATAGVSAVATIGYFAFLVGPPGIGFLGQHIGLLHALLSVLILVAAAGLAATATRSPALSGMPGVPASRGPARP